MNGFSFDSSVPLPVVREKASSMTFLVKQRIPDSADPSPRNKEATSPPAAPSAPSIRSDERITFSVFEREAAVRFLPKRMAETGGMDRRSWWELEEPSAALKKMMIEILQLVHSKRRKDSEIVRPSMKIRRRRWLTGSKRQQQQEGAQPRRRTGRGGRKRDAFRTATEAIEGAQLEDLSTSAYSWHVLPLRPVVVLLEDR